MKNLTLIEILVILTIITIFSALAVSIGLAMRGNPELFNMLAAKRVYIVN